VDKQQQQQQNGTGDADKEQSRKFRRVVSVVMPDKRHDEPHNSQQLKNLMPATVGLSVSSSTLDCIIKHS
jgi:hypothetical protein